MRKMNAMQRRRRTLLEELIKICGDRGLGPRHFAPVIHDTCSFGEETRPRKVKERQASMASQISEAGLMAQLSYLLDVWAEKRLRAKLQEMGGVLDAIVLQTSSSPDELEQDIGRDNVDVNGDVI